MEGIAVVVEKGGSELVGGWGEERAGDDRWFNSRYVLKIEPTGFADGFGMCQEGRSGGDSIIFYLTK